MVNADQKTLDGKTDCKKSKHTGSCTIRYAGNNKQIEAGLKEVYEKYPCIKITVNGKKMKEIPKEWDGEK